MRFASAISVDSSARTSWRDGDSLEDDVEDRVAHHDVLIAGARRTWQSEFAGVEFLVHEHGTLAVPSHDFHGVTAFADEDEQRARSRIHGHLLPNHPAEPLEAQAHVHRLERHVNRQPMRDHDVAPPPSASMTERSNSASNPRSTSTRASPTRTETPLGDTRLARADRCSRTSRANRGVGNAGRAFIQRYRLPGLMPTRRANLQGVSPDSFSSARYRCLSDSMNLLRMVPTCQLGRPGARWGWRSAYGGSRSSLPLDLGLKLFKEAQASIKVPSTVKCSLEI